MSEFNDETPIQTNVNVQRDFEEDVMDIEALEELAAAFVNRAIDENKRSEEKWSRGIRVPSGLQEEHVVSRVPTDHDALWRIVVRVSDNVES